MLLIHDVQVVMLPLLDQAVVHAALAPSYVLVQIDRLVQLLDTPGYTFLRLQLLQPQQHAPLLRALYALLMLLPQSNAFRSLSTRLSVSPPNTSCIAKAGCKQALEPPLTDLHVVAACSVAGCAYPYPAAARGHLTHTLRLSPCSSCCCLSSLPHPKRLGSAGQYSCNAWRACFRAQGTRQQPEPGSQHCSIIIAISSRGSSQVAGH